MPIRFSWARLGRFAAKHYAEEGCRYLYFYAAVIGSLAVLCLLRTDCRPAEVLYRLSFLFVLPGTFFFVLARTTCAQRDPERAVIDAVLPLSYGERFGFAALHSLLLGGAVPLAGFVAAGLLEPVAARSLFWAALPFHPMLLALCFKVRRSLLKGLLVLVALLAAVSLVWVWLASGTLSFTYLSVLLGLPDSYLLSADCGTEGVRVLLRERFAVPYGVRAGYEALLVGGLYLYAYSEWSRCAARPTTAERSLRWRRRRCVSSTAAASRRLRRRPAATDRRPSFSAEFRQPGRSFSGATRSCCGAAGCAPSRFPTPGRCS